MMMRNKIFPFDCSIWTFEEFYDMMLAGGFGHGE
jgi:hypothetical protein